MAKIIKKHKKLFLVVALIAILLGSSVFILKDKFSNQLNAQSGPGPNELRGWAWSGKINTDPNPDEMEGVGWISLNCYDAGVCATSDYKVSINPNNGFLSGWAWNAVKDPITGESIGMGWIKFDPQGPYPEAPHRNARVNMTTGEIDGWIRACVGAADGDCKGGAVNGWDGWIKITDAKLGPGGKIMSNSNPAEGGWGWDSEVGRWIKFWDASFANSSVSVPVTVDCNITAFPSNIAPSQSVALNWNCNSYVFPGNSCNIDNGVGARPGNGTANVNPAVTTTYTMTCQGLGGPDVSSATVTVSGGGTGTTTIPKIIETAPR